MIGIIQHKGEELFMEYEGYTETQGITMTFPEAQEIGYKLVMELVKVR